MIVWDFQRYLSWYHDHYKECSLALVKYIRISEQARTKVSSLESYLVC